MVFGPFDHWFQWFSGTIDHWFQWFSGTIDQTCCPQLLPAYLLTSLNMSKQPLSGLSLCFETQEIGAVVLLDILGGVLIHPPYTDVPTNIKESPSSFSSQNSPSMYQSFQFQDLCKGSTSDERRRL